MPKYVWGRLGAQLCKHHTIGVGAVRDLRVVRSRLAVGSTLGTESVWDFSPSAPPPPHPGLSWLLLSFSNKSIN